MPAPSDAPVSTDQAALIESGAKPVEADVAAIIAQLQSQMAEQQKYIDALLAEKGQSSDPVGQALLNLTAHVRARAAALPQLDFTELSGTVDEPSEDKVLHSTLVHDLVEELASKHHDLGYLLQLAREYRKAVVKATASGN